MAFLTVETGKEDVETAKEVKGRGQSPAGRVKREALSVIETATGSRRSK